MQITKNKSYNIQVLRGLAIVAVVFIHNTPAGWMQVWFRPFFNFAVGCFLFLSGVLSSADKWNPRKRIFKVMVPYVLWTIVYVIINSRKQRIINGGGTKSSSICWCKFVNRQSRSCNVLRFCVL